MHFCSVCENMYYIRIADEDSNKLIYYCRNCGHEKEPEETNIFVSKIKTNNKKKTYSIYQ